MSDYPEAKPRVSTTHPLPSPAPNHTTSERVARQIPSAARSLAGVQPLPRQQAARSPWRAWLRPLNYDGVPSGSVVSGCLGGVLKYSPGKSGTTEGARRAAEAPRRQGSASNAPGGAGRRGAGVSVRGGAALRSYPPRRPGAAARLLVRRLCRHPAAAGLKPPALARLVRAASRVPAGGLSLFRAVIRDWSVSLRPDMSSRNSFFGCCCCCYVEACKAFCAVSAPKHALL